MLASSHPILHLIVAVVTLVAIALYLLPTGIAIARRHHWTARIAVVNVLFGWTVIGWVVALHMSSTSRTKTDAYWRRPSPGTAPSTGDFIPTSLDETGRSPDATPTPTTARPSGASPAGDDWPSFPVPDPGPTHRDTFGTPGSAEDPQ